jgi:hypothetical protein
MLRSVNSEGTEELLEEFNAETLSLTRNPSEEEVEPEAPARAIMATIKIGDVEYPI